MAIKFVLVEIILVETLLVGHIKANTLISNHAAVELQQIEQENHKVYVHQINEQCTVFVLDMIK